MITYLNQLIEYNKMFNRTIKLQECNKVRIFTIVIYLSLSNRDHFLLLVKSSGLIKFHIIKSIICLDILRYKLRQHKNKLNRNNYKMMNIKKKMKLNKMKYSKFNWT